MILAELLTVVHCHIEVQLDNELKVFAGSQAVPLDLRHYVVESVMPGETAVRVRVRSSTESRQLEQYGFSFEDGF